MATNLYDLLMSSQKDELTRQKFAELRTQWDDGEIDDDSWQEIIDQMNEAGGYDNLPEL